MTLADVKNRAVFYAKTNTTDYAAADILISLNKWKNWVQSVILNSQDEWDYDDTNNTDFPISTTSLVANQQDYSLPTGSLKIKRVEITYDGTNWYKAEPIDINEIGDNTSTTSIANNFDKTKPYYDIAYNSIFLYPIPTASVDSGLKITYDRLANDFTSGQMTTGTLSLGFDAIWHDVVPLGIAYDWCVAKDISRAANLWSMILDYEQRIKQYYSNKQKDRQVILKSSLPDYE